MNISVVLTLTGPDRVGIVEEVTKLLLDVGGNVEASRMARLGGEFAILMLVSLPIEQSADLDQNIQTLSTQGYKVTTTQTAQTSTAMHLGWLPYQIEVHGADHEGIVHEVAAYVSQRGINIESMDTDIVHAPVSGTPLFTMAARVLVPPSLQNQNWEEALAEVGHHLNVDVKVSAVKEP